MGELGSVPGRWVPGRQAMSAPTARATPAAAAPGCGGRAHTVDEARALLRARLQPILCVERAPAQVPGATLAEPLVTATALPRVDTAAMDGYAVCGSGPWMLREDTRVAGAHGGRPLEYGQAVRIATGAPTPAGTTAVVRDEFVRTNLLSGDTVLARVADAPARDDIRRRGENWHPGTELAAAGTRVSAAVISAASSAEVHTIAVRGPLRADVLITGSEIRAEGPLAPGQTRDSIGPVLPTYLRACDIETTHVWRLDDCRELLGSWFALRSDADLVVVVGATGRGAADHLRALLTELRAEILIDGLAIRPGGSQLVALLPDGRVLLALPGNPFAAIAALLLTGPAIVNACTARTPVEPLRGRLADSSGTHDTVTRIVPVCQRPGGVWHAAGPVHTPHLASLITAQALALLPPRSGRGTLVELVPLPG
ncbi:molybdopterin biosynthesis protein [Nocardia cyriacigeorgica]|uniref:molybdopterin-binding protein n=1 Tax=Nocardia cyriacigeorgica TaxID=135487 RepID=UPI001895F4B2|nr:molybdopterin-binding protein [Nocardia cyriacigeorgica]MBF6098235.1 molybdopterin biosynthesis protein [Nocardia cyriacigeorgica]MBF6157721.1 molybdopterin biosynthesis protein [Nocardia cyriacigeorgica]MBF6196693.1 molybdopterin biosynthesis protein [Nocardia cyriacigeorgica]